MMNCADDSFGSTLIHFSFAALRFSLLFLFFYFDCFLLLCFVYCFGQHIHALSLSLSFYPSLGLSVCQLAQSLLGN